MNNINVNDLKEFIEGNSNKELTAQEITKLIMEIKLDILKGAKKVLDKALEEKDSAMVAAIAEVLKTI